MCRFLFLSIILSACTAKKVSAFDDFIEGEATTAEKIAQDLSTPAPLQGKQKPAVEFRVPIIKF